MRNWCMLLLLFSAAFARSVSRYGSSGSVNLVEFNIRGVIYGRCSSHSANGGENTVIYELRGKDLIAKSLNPTVVDPITKANQCRDAASHPPTERLDGRNDLGDKSVDLEQELFEQFADYDRKTQANYEYVSQLKPRFIKKIKKVLALGLGLSALGLGSQPTQFSAPDQNKNIGLSFGRFGQAAPSFFPGIHLMQPNKQQTTHTSVGVKKYGPGEVPGLGSILGGMFF